MKICSDKNCNQINPQPLNNFHKNKRTCDGLQTVCKICNTEIVRTWRKNNPKKRHVTDNNRHATKPEIKRARDARYRENNKEKLALKSSNWEKSNPEKANAKAARRRVLKDHRTPTWLTKLHQQHVEIFYDAAVKLTNELGVKMEVDHIIPLKGKPVSGLHVPWNLQVITKKENGIKSNKIKNP